MTEFNLADLWELVCDARSETTAIVTSQRRLTYAELDDRANRLANHLLAAGVAAGDHVGLLLVNGTEYLEGMLAAFKVRAVPVNVNYRYVSDELRYLFDDAELVALVVHQQFLSRALEALTTQIRHVLVVADGSAEPISAGAADYEQALHIAAVMRPFVGQRRGDDIYIAYTGGTTGMPKGVVWRQEDVFFGAMGGGDPLSAGNVISSPHELVARLPDSGLVALPTAPLMHVSAHWYALQTLFGGGTLVMAPAGRFDAQAVWRLVEDEKVNILVIIGDAMARPLIDELQRGSYDVSSLLVVASGGALLSPSSRARLAQLLPVAIIADGFGSSETGVMGYTSFHHAGAADGPTRFEVDKDTVVLDADGHPLLPGSTEVGRLARRGRIPIGYYKDADKTRSAFVQIAGERWVISGDMGLVAQDGSVILLGRDAASINTGGEKVYPEEVEIVLKAHEAIADAVVVGVPDERWGERVVALVQPVPGAAFDPESVRALCQRRLAGYKVPRELRVVPVVERSPVGKPDYRWARHIAGECGTFDSR